MKIGVEISIDVTKIDKARLFEGKKGKYLTMTTFIDVDNKDQYDNNGMITQDAPKDEQGAILGNAQVFWSDNQAPQQQQRQNPPAQQQSPMAEPDFSFDDDTPF